MIDREAKTYRQIMRKKRCYDLLQFCVLSDQSLTEIYDFLSEKPTNQIIVKDGVSFYEATAPDPKIIKTIPAEPRKAFSHIIIDDNHFVLYGFYNRNVYFNGVIVSRDYGNGGDGGGSSNNNNNNNNNNG